MSDIPRVKVRSVISLMAALMLHAVLAIGQTPVSSDEKIHPGDLIEIDELGGFDHDWRGRLNPDGYLDGFTKVADPIFARCTTTSELAASVREAYSRTLRDPKVTVRILDRSQRPVAIFDGAVRQPMRLQVRRNVRISELAVVTGGFTDRASGEITVLRPPNQSCETSGDSAELFLVRISDILAGKEGVDLSILSGDLVMVKVVEPVYVIGGVNNPGRIDWRDGATASRVVAAAGGVSGRGVTGRVTVFRRELGENKVIEVDLDKVLDGRAEDIAIRPQDIVDVPLRGDARRTAAPVIDAASPPTASRELPVRIID